jgi:AcrR family transcriptional regulator
MGPKQRRARQKESLRQEILDAARELFINEGYENVSMRRIAEKIEYSPTTIYLYFRDKAHLLFEVCEETFAQLARKGEQILKDRSDPIMTLRKIGRAYVDFGLKHPNHYRVAFINHPPHHNFDLKEWYENSMGQRAFNLLKMSVEECVKQGKFKPVDVDAASQALWAAVHGITSLMITHPDFPWVHPEQTIDLVIDSMCGGLRA